MRYTPLLLLIVLASEPLSSFVRADSTILPPPTNRVPCHPVLDALAFMPATLSSEAVEAKCKDAKQKRFPKFRVVVDNPSRGGECGNLVLIVAGNPKERETWSESARTHFGRAAFIYNDLFSVGDLATTLGRFPAGSVVRLIFGGHGEFSDGGVFMGIKNPPPRGRPFAAPEYLLFGEHINVENLMSTANKTNRAAIVRSLAKGAEVEFHVCVVGQERNLLNFAEAFERRCWANPGDVGEWGVGQYPWFFRDPAKLK